MTDPKIVFDLLDKNPLTRLDSKFVFKFRENGSNDTFEVSASSEVNEKPGLLKKILTDSFNTARIGIRAISAGGVREDLDEINEEDFIDVVSLYENLVAPARRKVMTSLMTGVINAFSERDPRSSNANMSWSAARLRLQHEVNSAINLLDDSTSKQLERYRLLATRSSDHERTASAAEADGPSPDEVLAGISQNADLGMRTGLLVPFVLTLDRRLSGHNVKGVLSLHLADPSIETAPNGDDGVPISNYRACISRTFVGRSDSLYVVQPWSKYANRPLTLLTPLRPGNDDPMPLALRSPTSVNSYTIKPFSVDDAIIKDLLIPQDCPSAGKAPAG
ncbi:MAG: hypothetical protein AB2795_21285, partial [Candidatus Thiodiazotropha endolucinida]